MAVGAGDSGPSKRNRSPCLRVAVRVGGRVPGAGFLPRRRNFGVQPWPGERATARRAPMEPPPCPHCDQPDVSLLRLVLIGELLVADETQLLRLAAVMQQCGLLPLAPAPDPALV